MWNKSQHEINIENNLKAELKRLKYIGQVPYAQY